MIISRIYLTCIVSYHDCIKKEITRKEQEQQNTAREFNEKGISWIVKRTEKRNQDRVGWKLIESIISTKYKKVWKRNTHSKTSTIRFRIRV